MHGNMATRLGERLLNQRNIKDTCKQPPTIKAQMDKQRSKTVSLEIGEERNKRKNAKHQDMIKDLQERVKQLELEKRLGFEAIRSMQTSIGFFQLRHIAGNEEEAIE